MESILEKKIETLDIYITPVFATDANTVSQVCSLLATNKISSCPILSNNQFDHQIEYYDFLLLLLDVLAKVPMDCKNTLHELMESLRNQKILDVPFVTKSIMVHQNSTVREVVQEFIKSRCHRVFCMEQSKFVGVISQSTIAKLVVDTFGLRATHKQVWAIGQQSVAYANVIEKNIISIEHHNTVMDALYQMHLNRISSVAILEQKKV
jgi:predicted transcriptional regulator